MSARPMATVAVIAASLTALVGCGDMGGTKPAPTETVLPTMLLDGGNVVSTNVTMPMPKGARPAITPNGAFTGLIGKPARSTVSGHNNVIPATGTSMLPVSWTFAAKQTGVNAGDKKTSVIVRTDKRSYLLSDDASKAKNVMLSLPNAEAKTARLAFVFDGLEQFTDKGSVVDQSKTAAAGFYDGHKYTGRASCPPVTIKATKNEGASFEATCSVVQTSRSPWLPERGWAAPGSQWLTASVLLGQPTWTFANADGTTVGYPTVNSSVTYAAIDKTGAVAIKHQGAQNTMTFQAPAGDTATFTMTATYRGKASGRIPNDVPMQQTLNVQATSNVVFDAS